MNCVYILKCGDGSLYTGSTVDLEERVRKHNGLVVGGAKYTRARRPVKVVYKEEYETLPEARAMEAKIKRMTREEKLRLVV